jgi:hypothetical protein
LGDLDLAVGDEQVRALVDPMLFAAGQAYGDCSGLVAAAQHLGLMGLDSQ